MRERIPTRLLGNGAGRYGLYNEDGNLVQYVYIRPEDEPTQEGTPLNKAVLLSDETAAAIGLEDEDPTVDGALAALAEAVDGKQTKDDTLTVYRYGALQTLSGENVPLGGAGGGTAGGFVEMEESIPVRYRQENTLYGLILRDFG